MSNYSNLIDPHATDDGSERGRAILAALLFAAMSSLAAIDLASDIGEGASVSHWAIEGALLIASLVGLAVMVRALWRLFLRATRLEVETSSLSDRLRREAAASSALRGELLETAEEVERWRNEAQELVRGLSHAIDDQFDRWSLTEAEKEVSMLLLKGLSHKEVAAVRDTSDATTRQQARAVYKKAGLSGRNDLSAFFLEDLLVPAQRTRGPAGEAAAEDDSPAGAAERMA